MDYETYSALRDKMGMKDADVVKATGVRASTFSDWKHGRSSPKQEKLAKICSALGISSIDYTLEELTKSGLSVELEQTASQLNDDYKRRLIRYAQFLIGEQKEEGENEEGSTVL